MRFQANKLEPLLVTAREAARALAVSQRTLWGLTARGDLACVRIGRAVRYDVEDLKVFINRRKEKNGAQKETPAAGSTTGAQELHNEAIEGFGP